MFTITPQPVRPRQASIRNLRVGRAGGCSFLVEESDAKASALSLDVSMAEAEPLQISDAAPTASNGSHLLSLSKGERSLLAAAPPPRVIAELPEMLHGERILTFMPQHYDLYGTATQLLSSLPSLGYYPPGDAAPLATGAGVARVADDSPTDSATTVAPARLESFHVTADVFRSFKARQVLYRAVGGDAPFLRIYERLVLEVVLPALLNACDTAPLPGLGPAAVEHLYYQYPPTMRLQPGPSTQHGRVHRDAEYGHQSGEINCWMPLSSYALTRTTLWVETAPGAADFHPLEVDHGQIACFHGALRHHYAPANPSHSLRVSLDFRIGVGVFFDPEWSLPGVKASHSWRRVNASSIRRIEAEGGETVKES